MFEDDFFEFIDNLGITPVDFSNDVLPFLVGKIYTHHTDSTFIDIGTPDSLAKAQDYFPKLNPSACITFISIFA